MGAVERFGAHVVFRVHLFRKVCVAHVRLAQCTGHLSVGILGLGGGERKTAFLPMGNFPFYPLLVVVDDFGGIMGGTDVALNLKLKFK